MLFHPVKKDVLLLIIFTGGNFSRRFSKINPKPAHSTQNLLMPLLSDKILYNDGTVEGLRMDKVFK